MSQFYRQLCNLLLKTKSAVSLLGTWLDLERITFPRFQQDYFCICFLFHALFPCVPVLGEQVKGVVVNRYDNLRLQKLDRAQSVIGAHRVIVTDRDNSQIESLFADQFHIAE